MHRKISQRRGFLCFLAFSGFLLGGQASSSPVYTSVNADADPAWDRVRIFLSTQTEPKNVDIEYFTQPFRVQVTLDGSLEGVEEGVTRYSDSYLKSFRVSSGPGRNRVQLTAYLNEPTKGVTSRFSRTDSLQFFHIDIPRPQRYQQPTWTPSSLARAKSSGMPVAIVDPGHGSWEPGAISNYWRSLQEKDVNLSIGTEVARILRQNGRVYPIMSRSGDYYPTLDERVELVRDTGADLFVSIHADSDHSRGPKGFGVWVIDRERSDVSSEARRLLIFGWQHLLARYSVRQQNLMMDRQQRFVEDETNRAARIMVASLDRLPGVENRGVKTHKKALRVLKHSFAPSILIEAGFLSNRSDSDRLRRKGHRDQMAHAIADGIEAYFEQRDRSRVSPPLRSSSVRLAKAPEGTPPERYAGETFAYRVRRRDTLAGLAKEYEVEKEDILIASGLPLSRRILYADEMLRIPKKISAPLPTEPYQVDDTDTLLKIAHRYGITVSQLLKINGWSDGRSPQPGEWMRVPSGGGGSDDAAAPAERVALESLERTWVDENGRDCRRSEEVASLAPSTQEEPDLWNYEVQPGDTLSKIAGKLGLEIQDLRRYNGLRNDLIRVGQVLHVPVNKSTLEHRVKKGETLSEIANRFGVRVEDVQRLNGLKSGTIRVDQVLRIPVGKVTWEHRVEKGETLEEISSRYEVAVDRIKQLNEKNSDRILAGEILRIR